MYSLVIALDKACNLYETILSGTYEDISIYTTKYNDSLEIRKKNKGIISDFNSKYKDNGDIVVINSDLPNVRFRVLYKKDIEVVKEIIKSRNFMKYLVKKRILKNISEWDYKIIMYAKENEYQLHIKKWLNNRKQKEDFYKTVSIIERYYDEFAHDYKDIPTRTMLYKAIKAKREKIKQERKSKTIKMEELREIERDYLFTGNEVMDNNEIFNQIYSLFAAGGIEEVLNLYSIDFLYQELKEDELKILGLGGYKK